VGETYIDALIARDSEVAAGLATKSDTTHNHAGTYVAVAGDTMTGALALPSDGLAVGTKELVVAGSKVGVGTNAPTDLFEVAAGETDSVLDQEYTNVLAAGTDIYWQSFKAGKTGTLAEVRIRTTGGYSGLLQIHEGEDTGEASKLHSQDVTLATGVDGVVLDSTVPVTEGDIYTIHLVDGAPWWMHNAGTYADGRSSFGAGFDNYFITYVGSAKVFAVTPRGINLIPRKEAPTSPVEGDIYYNAVDHKAYCWDDTTWQPMWP